MSTGGWQPANSKKSKTTANTAHDGQSSARTDTDTGTTALSKPSKAKAVSKEASQVSVASSHASRQMMCCTKEEENEVLECEGITVVDEPSCNKGKARAVNSDVEMVDVDAVPSASEEAEESSEAELGELRVLLLHDVAHSPMEPQSIFVPSGRPLCTHSSSPSRDHLRAEPPHARLLVRSQELQEDLQALPRWG